MNFSVARHFAAFAACSAAALLAQPAPNASMGVIVSEISDTRSTLSGVGECRVVLSLTGDAASDAHSVRRVRLSKAIDDTGRDLIKDAEFDVPAAGPFSPSAADEAERLLMVADEVTRRRLRREQAAGNLEQTVSPALAPRPLPAAAGAAPMRMPGNKPSFHLRNPSRQSTTIKLVEGEVELFTPTEANGGNVRVASFAARPAEFIRHEALEGAGIKLMYLTREAYEARRAAATAAGEADAPWTEAVANALKARSRIGGQNAVLFFVDDPQQRMVALDVETAGGKAIRHRPSFAFSGIHSLFLDKPLPDDAQLVVRIAVDAAISRHAFKLENIALP